MHLSAELSGSCGTARAPAREVDGVVVVDSRLATGGIALLAHRAFLFLPTTLDYLYRGGRIGRASHLVGTLLNIKPVLEIKDGVADAYKKARGLRQALEIMRDAVIERTCPGSDVYVNFSHGLNLPVMEQLKKLVLAFSDRRIHLRPPSIVGSIIGTYIGPGAVGLGFVQE